ncbi:MAG: hypothetical protein JXR73_06855 [Candidatus Omnitrophica bacterium]|nr:hypothetical protein [Candidatus Omnitrophota bacterium]
MAKENRLNIRISQDLHEWLQQFEKGETTKFVEFALNTFSEFDYELLENTAKELGLIPGRLIEVALLHFSSLSPEEQNRLISKDFAFRSKKP